MQIFFDLPILLQMLEMECVEIGTLGNEFQTSRITWLREGVEVVSDVLLKLDLW